MDDFKTAIKLKTNGIYYSSTNNKINVPYKSSFKIIGSAHCQREYYFKKKQACEYIFLSPLFENKKYSNNKNIIHQFAPIDSPQIVKRFFLKWKPNIIFFTDSELWPNQIFYEKIIIYL